ncbi:MAG: c-type cytochrome [Bauldia sp.]
MPEPALPPVAAVPPAPAQPEPTVVPPADTDPALAARLAAADAEAGRAIAARCSACHSVAAGGPNGVGPNLYGIVGAPVGAVPGFTYSPAFAALAAAGGVWSYDLLDAFLASPSVTVPGTRMGFGGLADEGQRADLIAYLRTLAVDPVPLPGEPAAVDELRAAIVALGLLPVTFTAEQAQIGRDSYVRYCSACHGLSFEGIWYGTEWGQAPALIGDGFERRWFLRTLADFVTAMEETDIINYASMHQGLRPDGYAAVAAYLLEQYGFVPGDVPLPADRATLRGIGFWQDLPPG